jgi:hypothetical protein
MKIGRREMDNEDEEKDLIDKKIVIEFMVEMLLDLTVMKSNIYNNRVFDAHRNVQMLSDKIKDKVKKL